MDVTALVHLGENLPVHFYDCIAQFREFNNSDLVMIMSDHLVETFRQELIKRALRCSIEPASAYEGNRCKEFDVTFSHGGGFWNVTTRRIFLLDEFVYQRKLPAVYHFENDVLIYHDLSQHHETCRSFYKTLLTDGSVDKIMLGFSYLRADGLCSFSQFILDETKNPQAMRRHSYDWLSDMTLLKVWAKEQPECVDYFPTLPDSFNLEAFGDSLYDPASWGQYVGGTANGHAPGFTDPTHIIGAAIRENPSWQIDFGFEAPYLKIEEKCYKINNLHIHSKQLNKFRTLTCQNPQNTDSC